MPRLIKKFLEVKSLLVICITFTVLATIAFLAPLNGAPTFNFVLPIDKLVHILIYLSLSFLWISYIDKATVNLLGSPILIVVFICFFYGIVIEAVQELFIPLRKADFLDVLANMIGVFFGVILFKNVKNRIKS